MRSLRIHQVLLIRTRWICLAEYVRITTAPTVQHFQCPGSANPTEVTIRVEFVLWSRTVHAELIWTSVSITELPLHEVNSGPVE